MGRVQRVAQPADGAAMLAQQQQRIRQLEAQVAGGGAAPTSVELVQATANYGVQVAQLAGGPGRAQLTFGGAVQGLQSGGVATYQRVTAVDIAIDLQVATTSETVRFAAFPSSFLSADGVRFQLSPQQMNANLPGFSVQNRLRLPAFRFDGSGNRTPGPYAAPVGLIVGSLSNGRTLDFIPFEVLPEIGPTNQLWVAATGHYTAP